MRILSLTKNARNSDMLASRLKSSGLKVMHCTSPKLLRSIAPGKEVIVVTDDSALASGQGALASVIRELHCVCVVVMKKKDLFPVTSAPDPEERTDDYQAWRLINGGLTLVTRTGIRIGLSHTEADFLELLISHSGRVVQTRGGIQLGARKRHVTEETLRTMISRLRGKVARYGVELPVRSAYGSGYVFVPRCPDISATQAAGLVACSSDDSPRMHMARSEVLQD